MKRTRLLGGVFLLASLTNCQADPGLGGSIASLAADDSATSMAAKWLVSPTADPQTTISSAIAGASAGDSILFAPGDYYYQRGGGVVLDRPLALGPADPSHPPTLH